jgi:hypothetical protein
MDNTILQLLFLIANLIILGFNIKLYTEILKDRKQDERSKRNLG